MELLGINTSAGHVLECAFPLHAAGMNLLCPVSVIFIGAACLTWWCLLATRTFRNSAAIQSRRKNKVLRRHEAWGAGGIKCSYISTNLFVFLPSKCRVGKTTFMQKYTASLSSKGSALPKRNICPGPIYFCAQLNYSNIFHCPDDFKLARFTVHWVK